MLNRDFDSKFDLVASGTFEVINESGLHYVANAVTDKPSTTGGAYILASPHNDGQTQSGLYLPNNSSEAPCIVTCANGVQKTRQLVTNADYPGYKPLWSGTLTTGGTVSIPDIASYNTYAIVSSSYPAVLWGHRWGSKINAFGFDGNASNAFRLMSVILSIDGDKITVTKSKVAAMTFGAVNGSASDLPITNIYGIS